MHRHEEIPGEMTQSVLMDRKKKKSCKVVHLIAFSFLAFTVRILRSMSTEYFFHAPFAQPRPNVAIWLWSKETCSDLCSTVPGFCRT